MPVVFRHLSIRFYFFSNEENPRELVHIHATRSGADAKLWLLPEVKIAESSGFSRHEQADLVRVVEIRQDDIIRVWHEHFSNDGPF